MADKADVKLTREAIIDAAIEVADTDGLVALSMRRIADRLGAGTMSLYRHVADKDALLRAMTDTVAANTPYPSAEGKSWTWRERVLIAGDVDWVLYRRHPWILFAYAAPRYSFGPGSLDALNWLMTGFDELGVTRERALQMSLSVWSVISGAALPDTAESMIRSRKDEEPEEISGLEAIFRGQSQHPIPPMLQEFDGQPPNAIDGYRLMRLTLDALCDGFAAEGQQTAR